VLLCNEWIYSFRDAGENTGTIFPGAVAAWTADQKRLVSVSKEYANVFSSLAMRGHDRPDEEILHNYRKFQEWWDEYTRDPEIGENPYKKYSQGFSTRG